MSKAPWMPECSSRDSLKAQSVDLHGEVTYALVMERDVKIDKIDLKIIEILKRNGRMPNKEKAPSATVSTSC
jgi:hypothetical protein